MHKHIITILILVAVLLVPNIVLGRIGAPAPDLDAPEQGLGGYPQDEQGLGGYPQEGRSGALAPDLAAHQQGLVGYPRDDQGLVGYPRYPDYRMTINEVEVKQLDISPELRMFNASGGMEDNFLVFDPRYEGGINLATVDLGGDGQDEILIGAGFGNQPQVKIFREDGSQVNHFLVYNENFKGGVNVAAGDLDGDGKDEIIVGAGIYGGPHVRVFDGYGQPKLTAGFFADGADLRTGVQVAAGNVSGDSRDEIICGIEKDKKFVIKIFGLRQVDNSSSRIEHYVIKEFNAFDKVGLAEFSLATGDINGDRINEIIVGIGTGGLPEVRVFNPDGELLNKFLAYNQNFRGGVQVVVADLDKDGKDEIITGAGFSGGPHIRIFDGQGNVKVNPGFFAYDKNYRGGVNIAAGHLYNKNTILTVPRLTLIQGKNFYKAVEIDVSEQKMRAYQNGFLVEEGPVSSGTWELPTPLGDFKFLKKSLEEYSEKYDLYMPNWMQFTWSGAGLHGLPYWKYTWGLVYEGVGHLGYRVSHGCVRLGLDMAKRVYNWVDVGDRIVVHE